MPRSFLLPFVLGALLLVVGAPRARACLCIKERSELAQSLSYAELIVFGTVSEPHKVDGFSAYTVEVQHVLKGGHASLSQMELLTGPDLANCNVQLTVGDSYLLWPHSTQEPLRYAISTCNFDHLRMTPAEFDAMRAELEAVIAASLPDAAVGDAGAAGSPGEAGAALVAQPVTAVPANEDASADGCALGAGGRQPSSVWLWLSTLALRSRARSRLRRRRPPAPAP